MERRSASDKSPPSGIWRTRKIRFPDGRENRRLPWNSNTAGSLRPDRETQGKVTRLFNHFMFSRQKKFHTFSSRSAKNLPPVTSLSRISALPVSVCTPIALESCLQFAETNKNILKKKKIINAIAKDDGSDSGWIKGRPASRT